MVDVERIVENVQRFVVEIKYVLELLAGAALLAVIELRGGDDG